ncbi:MAG: hypothetical protein HY821_24680 [Acidobacteria bacterium]|nr:hypothetical protein [Acidobacteriota bacterium]
MLAVRLPIFAGLLLAAGSLCAQQDQPKPITSVAMFKVTPDKMGSFMETMKIFPPVLDKLMADGSLLGYGVDADVLHSGGTNVAFWISGPGFAAIDKSEKAIGDAMKANPEKMKLGWGATDFGAHRDLLVRSVEGKMGKVPAGTLPFTDFSEEKVKPGKMPVAMMLFRHFEKPVLDKLVEDGVIYGYSVDVEAVHTSEPGKIWFLTIMPNLAAKDKVRAAMMAAMAKMPESDRTALEEIEKDVFVASAHRDSISEALIFKTK